MQEGLGAASPDKMLTEGGKIAACRHILTGLPGPRDISYKERLENGPT